MRGPEAIDAEEFEMELPCVSALLIQFGQLGIRSIRAIVQWEPSGFLYCCLTPILCACNLCMKNQHGYFSTNTALMLSLLLSKWK